MERERVLVLCQGLVEDESLLDSCFHGVSQGADAFSVVLGSRLTMQSSLT